MRILSIRLKNINSLRGEQEIAFDQSPLREAGVFGMVGATGSGKSTLLDCITLALYGRVPRFGVITKNVLDKGGAILTRHEKDCYASVTYSCKKGVFTSSWAVSKTKNDTFRDVEMKVLSEAGLMLNERLSDAPAVNIGNIGLDYDQFVKSILLCQGEFAKFLQSDKNNRALLLEKITGAKEFRKIGIKAFQAHNKRKKEIEVITEAISMHRESLLGNEEREQLATAIQLSDQRSLQLQLLLEEARLKLDKKQRLAQLRTELKQKIEASGIAKKDLDGFSKEHAGSLAHYDKLFIYKEDLNEHLRLFNQVGQLQQKVADFEKQIRDNDKGITKLVVELKDWVKEEISANDYLQHLKGLRDKVRDATARQKEQQNVLKGSYDRLMPLLSQPVFATEKNLFRTKGNNDQLLMKLATRKGDARKTFDDTLKLYSIQQEQLDLEKLNLTDLNSSIALLQSDVRSFMQQKQKIHSALERIEKLKHSVQELEGSSSQQKLQLETLLRQLQEAEKEKQQMLHAEKLDGLRASLVDGEPCPLCGSAHHPYVHEFALELLGKNDGFEKIQASYQRIKTEWEQTDHKKRSDASLLAKEEQELSQQQKDLGKYSDAIEAWKQKLKIDKIQNEERIASLLQENKEKLGRVEHCIQYLRDQPLMMQLEKEVQTYDRGLAGLAQVEEELTSLYSGNDFEEQYLRRESQMKTLQDMQKLAKEQWKINTKEQQDVERMLTGLETTLLAGLAKAGYPDIAKARSFMISELEQKQLVDQQKNLLSAFSNAQSVLSDLEIRVGKEAEGDDTAVDAVQQQEIVAQYAGQIKSLRLDLDAQRTKLGSDDQKREDIERSETEKSKLLDAIRPWEMLNKLIGDANGNKFNTRAQELSLQHLLILANRRMNKLHSRYSLLLPEKLEDDDLRVADAHMGGEVRTVRSLSGGETFVISLALALGLSDLASRDIKIESLFVDEGFGSLDPETLEEAMSTLEQLQNESNKMVGIISHVDSLKERIYTQIRLEKSNNGFSTISIFPEVKTADEQEG